MIELLLQAADLFHGLFDNIYNVRVICKIHSIQIMYDKTESNDFNINRFEEFINIHKDCQYHLMFTCEFNGNKV